MSDSVFNNDHSSDAAGGNSSNHPAQPSLSAAVLCTGDSATTCKPTKISGTAKVIRVNPTYGYILSEKYGSIFVLPASVLHNFPESERKTIKIDLSTLLHVDDIVHFLAVSQKNNPNGCHWIAQKVNLSLSANSNFAGTVRNGSNAITPKKAFTFSGKKSRAARSLNFTEGPVRHHTSRNGDEPETIENVKGIVLDVYEKYGFIQSELYGRIYLPLSACFVRSAAAAAAARQNEDFTTTRGDDDDVWFEPLDKYCAADAINCSEFQKLNDSFFRNDLVVFSAKRQPEKNGCRYVVTSVKEIVSESELREAASSNRHWSLNLPLLDLQLLDEAAGYGPVPVTVAQTGLTTLPAYDDALNRSALNQSPHLSNRPVSPAPTSAHPISLPTETGEISKLFPHFGFIKNARLGAIYFTLSNYAGDRSGGGTGITGSAESSALTAAPVTEPVLDLNDVLTVGDRVQFLYSPQPEKNGCCWRAARIRKLAGLSADDFEEWARYLQLQESAGDSVVSSSVPYSGLTSNTIDYNRSATSAVKIMMEVATQTDQKMWHTFFSNQRMASHQKTATCRKNAMKSRDACTQTLVPPEILLMQTLKRDPAVWAELGNRYPDLMKYVEKLT